MKCSFTATRDVEHDGGVLSTFPAATALMSDASGDTGRRVDVHALEFVEELARLARHSVRRDEELSARGFQRIVKPAGDGVGRTAVDSTLASMISASRRALSSS